MFSIPLLPPPTVPLSSIFSVIHTLANAFYDIFVQSYDDSSLLHEKKALEGDSTGLVGKSEILHGDNPRPVWNVRCNNIHKERKKERTKETHLLSEEPFIIQNYVDFLYFCSLPCPQVDL